MNELSEGAQRAAKRISGQLKSARHGYWSALLDLKPFVEKAARAGDPDARRLLDEVERAYDVLLTENLAAADMLGLG